MENQITFRMRGIDIPQTSIVIEVWFGEKLRATIMPGDPDQPAFRVVSTHIATMEKSVGGITDIYQFNLFTD